MTEETNLIETKETVVKKRGRKPSVNAVEIHEQEQSKLAEAESRLNGEVEKFNKAAELQKVHLPEMTGIVVEHLEVSEVKSKLNLFCEPYLSSEQGEVIIEDTVKKVNELNIPKPLSFIVVAIILGLKDGDIERGLYAAQKHIASKCLARNDASFRQLVPLVYLRNPMEVMKEIILSAAKSAEVKGGNLNAFNDLKVSLNLNGLKARQSTNKANQKPQIIQLSTPQKKRSFEVTVIQR